MSGFSGVFGEPVFSGSPLATPGGEGRAYIPTPGTMTPVTMPASLGETAMSSGFSGVFGQPAFSDPVIPMQKGEPVGYVRAGDMGPHFDVRPTPPNFPGASIQGLGAFAGNQGTDRQVTSESQCELFRQCYQAREHTGNMPRAVQSFVGSSAAPQANGGQWEARFSVMVGKTSYYLNLFDRGGGWVVGSTTKAGENQPRTKIIARIADDNTIVGDMKSRISGNAYIFRLVLGPGGVGGFTEERTRYGECPAYYNKNFYIGTVRPLDGASDRFQTKWGLAADASAPAVIRGGSAIWVQPVSDTPIRGGSTFTRGGAGEGEGEGEGSDAPRWGLWIGLGVAVLGGGFLLRRALKGRRRAAV